MYFNFSALSLIAAVVMSSVSAAANMEGAINHNAIADTSDVASERVNLAISKRNFLSRRKVTNVLERRKIVCNHKNHKTYQRGDELKHHYHPHRHHHCDSDDRRCGEFDSDDFELEYNNDYGEDEFDGSGDEDYYECDECNACDDDEDYYLDWSDYEDETT